MKKSIFQMLREGRSDYIPVRRDGRDVIRVSGHAPSPSNLLRGEKTRHCKNVFLIFVKNMIDETRENSAALAKFIRWKESDNANERELGEIALNLKSAVAVNPAWRAAGCRPYEAFEDV